MMTIESRCQPAMEHGIRDRVTNLRKVYIGDTGRQLTGLFTQLFERSGAYSYYAPLETPEYYSNVICKGAHRGKNLQALSQMSDGPDPTWYLIRGFGKNEGTKVTKFNADYWKLYYRNLGDATPGLYPAMRFIAAMDRRGNLDMRRSIGGMEKRFLSSRGFDDSTPHVSRVFMKGLNTTQRASALLKSWGCYHSPVAFMLDASRADAHIRKDLHKAKFDMYMSMLSSDARAHLARIMPYYLKPKFARTSGIKVKVDGYLMSGVIDTSLTANIVFWMLHSLFRMACVNAHGVGDIVRSEIPGFPTLKLGKYDWMALLDGDDCVLMCESAFASVLQPHIGPFYALFGVEMRVEGVVSRFEDIEFCQSKPVEFAPGRFKMVRDPKKVVCSVLSSAKWSNLTSIDLKYRLATIGACETILNLGVPVLQEFALACLRNGDRRKFLTHDVSGSFFRAQIEMRKFGMTELRVMSPSPITPEARCSFERAFGMDVNTQFYWESVFQKWKLPEIVVPMKWNLSRGFWE